MQGRVVPALLGILVAIFITPTPLIVLALVVISIKRSFESGSTNQLMAIVCVGASVTLGMYFRSKRDPTSRIKMRDTDVQSLIYGPQADAFGPLLLFGRDCNGQDQLEAVQVSIASGLVELYQQPQNNGRQLLHGFDHANRLLNSTSVEAFCVNQAVLRTFGRVDMCPAFSSILGAITAHRA